MDPWTLVPEPLRQLLGSSPQTGAARLALAWLGGVVLFTALSAWVRRILTHAHHPEASRARRRGGDTVRVAMLTFLVAAVTGLALLVAGVATATGLLIASKWGSLLSGSPGPLAGRFDWNWVSYAYLAAALGHSLLLTWRYGRDVGEEGLSARPPRRLAKAYFRRWWGKWHAVWILFVLGGCGGAVAVLETQNGFPRDRYWIWGIVAACHGLSLWLTPWLLVVARSMLVNLYRLPGRQRRAHRIWSARVREERWLASRGLTWPEGPWKLYVREPGLTRAVRHIVLQDGRGGFEPVTWCGTARAGLRIEDAGKAKGGLCPDCGLADRVRWLDLMRRRAQGRGPVVTTPKVTVTPPPPPSQAVPAEVTMTRPPEAAPEAAVAPPPRAEEAVTTQTVPLPRQRPWTVARIRRLWRD
ncbi:hypothetical protein [Phytomonospora endophytica]|uniref:Uncharacterized protein n=1 Tax=Phytomonospora endophytica TaxID=714109 RepID=A0A841FXD9_9ACTN|nr:hypothetical protein [Phytomonospora endophytica]MBB6038017.1 hypothetical protein [Phytomonospora endophytica]GIG68916.1 hypothetical protein Pen01_52110 [Phytomonospora endophytica]